MNKIKKGDIVGRISYNKDIIFIVKDIRNKNNVILEGVFERIIADSSIYDLELIDKKEINIKEALKEYELKRQENRIGEYSTNGKILHLDGDTHLSNQKKYSNTNTSEQVIFNHNKNNVSKIKIHYFFITKREEFCEREHI